MSKQLSNIKVKNYKQLALPSYSLPESLLPYQNNDTLLVFFPLKAYKVDSSLNLCDSLPNDFTHFDVENNHYLIFRPFGAVWFDNKLLLGDADCVMRYNIDLSKDTLLRFRKLNSYAHAGYYNNMAINENYAYLSSAFDLKISLWFGTDNAFRITKIDDNLNVLWDKVYKNLDGYYYSIFNTVATKDGGCIIATTRNNYETQGKSLDIYLLKLDSLGNYTPTNIDEPNNEKMVIYPNPGNDSFTVNCKTEFCGDVLILYNSFGVVQLQQQITSTTQTINTSGLTAGMYIYEIRNNQEIVLRGKWIKNN